jgi:hypothetical protein
MKRLNAREEDLRGHEGLGRRQSGVGRGAGARAPLPR